MPGLADFAAVCVEVDVVRERCRRQHLDRPVVGEEIGECDSECEAVVDVDVRMVIRLRCDQVRSRAEFPAARFLGKCRAVECDQCAASQH